MMDRHPPLVVIIGGVDPTGGAGIFADIRALSAAGVRIATCITSITAQNSTGLLAFESVSRAILDAQLRSITLDHTIQAVKIGMIGDSRLVAGIRVFLENNPNIPVILDPVMSASAGGNLADHSLIQQIRTELFPHVALLTPNLPELFALTGCDPTRSAGIRMAAECLIDEGCAAVLVKGGHRPGSPIDRLFTRQGIHAYRSTRLPGAIRGTGCQMASYIAGRIAQGDTLHCAIQRARAYIRRLFRRYGCCGGRLLGAWMPLETEEGDGRSFEN